MKLALRAKENQLLGLKQFSTVSSKLTERLEPLDTDREVAKVAGVSHDMIIDVRTGA